MDVEHGDRREFFDKGGSTLALVGCGYITEGGKSNTLEEDAEEEGPPKIVVEDEAGAGGGKMEREGANVPPQDEPAVFLVTRLDGKTG